MKSGIAQNVESIYMCKGNHALLNVLSVVGYSIEEKHPADIMKDSLLYRRAIE